MELSSVDGVSRAMRSKGPVAIFFYMTGCPHCEVMHAPWSALAKETKGVKFYKAESDSVPSELGITGYPQFMRFEDGKMRKSVGGEMDTSALRAQLFGGGRRRRTARRGARRLTRRRR